ncbi:MAG: hypothetical protein E7487_01420 [Ruminococcaceae bacterium]|nr:hypothetical protein [Oscillospiraceae bacterium]
MKGEIVMMKDIFKYGSFTSKEIKPSGWLLRQLQIQAEGLSGNLDKMWPDIRDSAWIGGDKEGWERVPYWLDGFIPLAYLLDDEDLKSRAQRYIDAIIEGQKPDGWICPCEEVERSRYDVWAYFLICKVLVVYFECSGDERIEGVISRALKYLKIHLRGSTLFCWGAARWFECMIPILWLYDRKKEEWLEELAITLGTQGTDYKRLFRYWKDQQPRREWSYQTHVVNLAMALKSEAVFSGITGEDPGEFAEMMHAMLIRHHGTAVGHFTGDECLAGDSPVQGTELCGVAEAMYSYELIARITGDPIWADRTEFLAFNAFPATTSPDMWTHQYDQMTNQIACVKMNEPPVFGSNNVDANRFGLEPNFGCCTANFNQTWPKFALNTFVKSEEGVVSWVLAPSVLTTEQKGVPVKITLDTKYPFGGKLVYTVVCDGEAEFSLGIRIPSFASKAFVDSEEAECGKIFTINRVWSGENTVTVDLMFEIQMNERPENMFALQRGPLVYAVPIKERWVMDEYTASGVERKFPYCDYDIYPESQWQYAFASEDFAVEEGEISDLPFSAEKPPVTIETELAVINWGTMEGQPLVCRRTPLDTAAISVEKVKLQPYGCTNLHMTELPKAKR